MIVISGVLVLVALVLLIAGLIVSSSGLALVYASIGVSLVAAIFLFLGVRQRRDEPLPVTAPADGEPPAAVPTTAPPPLAGTAPPIAATPPVPPQPTVPAPVPTPAPEAFAPAVDEPVAPVEAPRAPASAATAPAVASGAEVYVVPGRPRYHVAGCRYLAGRQTEEREVAEARAEGFSPCGVCRPDEVIAAAAPAYAEDDYDEDEYAQGEYAEDAYDEEEYADEEGYADEPAAGDLSAPSPGGAEDVTTAYEPVVEPAPAETPLAAPATEPETAPGAAVRDAAPRTSRPAAARVVVVPGRGRYHRPDCRYVRDVADTQELAKTTARRQGYQACGVCKP